MNLNDLAIHVAAEFQKTYGRPPRWIAAAPGRVNLIGEHTDYNEGFVLPMAIEFHAVMAADRPLDAGNVITLQSTQEQERVRIDLSEPVRPCAPKWGNYPRGVVARFLARGIDPGGLDVLLHSTVPAGSGLSSSAALEVCTATLIEAVTGESIDPIEKALLAQKAEYDFAGVPCGIMDQFVSTLGRKGHLLLIDCRSHKTELVPMGDPTVEVLIINTNVKHELASGEYAARRAECGQAAKIIGVASLRDATAEKLEKSKARMSGVVYRRARHVIGEILRTVQATREIREANWPAVGQLMYESHFSLRDDYEVSCKELDAIVEIAAEIGQQGGVFGCRMTGAGFGGCAVALVKADSMNSITRKIAMEYRSRTGIEAAFHNSRPAEGATIIKP